MKEHIDPQQLATMMRQFFRLSRYMEGILDRDLRPDGLTAKQLFLLALIEREFTDPPAVSELAEKALTSHQNIMQMARQLEKRGFLILEQDQHDRRTKRISLTEKHHHFWAHRAEEDAKRIVDLFEPLSAGEMEQLGALLQRLELVLAKKYEGREEEDMK